MEEFAESLSLFKERIKKVISFSGKSTKYVVGIVDIVDSTKIAVNLSKEETCRYYEVFLNTMSQIIHEEGGYVVKNVGDSLLFYFPDCNYSRPSSFIQPVKCCMAIISCLDIVNEIMREKGLPKIRYRVSADYGDVLIAKSTSSLCPDIFGSTVNICAKINKLAKPDQVVLGGDLCQIIKEILPLEIRQITSLSTGLKSGYPVYVIADGIIEKRTSKIKVSHITVISAAIMTIIHTFRL